MAETTARRWRAAAVLSLEAAWLAGWAAAALYGALDTLSGGPVPWAAVLAGAAAVGAWHLLQRRPR